MFSFHRISSYYHYILTLERQRRAVPKMNWKKSLRKAFRRRRLRRLTKLSGAIGGYKHASTDDIVGEAGISKGLLFHYFGSKLGLYSFLYDYSVRFMKLELTGGVSSTERDYFEIRRQRKFSATRCCTSNDVFIKFSLFLYIFSFHFHKIALVEIVIEIIEILIIVEIIIHQRVSTLKLTFSVEYNYSTTPRGIQCPAKN